MNQGACPCVTAPAVGLTHVYRFDMTFCWGMTRDGPACAVAGHQMRAWLNSGTRVNDATPSGLKVAIYHVPLVPCA